jgi:hypothetical protein
MGITTNSKDETGRMKDENSQATSLVVFILHPSAFILFIQTPASPQT